MVSGGQVGSRDISWGVVGTNHWEMLRLQRNIDRDGVVREVERGISYVLDSTGTANVALPFSRWKKRTDGIYEMDLFEIGLDLSDKPKFTTLVDLRAKLQSKRPENGELWRGGEPELKELDQIAGELLRIAAKLHEQGFGVGLLRPDNVVLIRRPEDGSKAIILPDFGFVRFRGVLPEWMRPDVKYKDLWDKPPEWMNERCFDRERHTRAGNMYAATADKVEGSGLDPQMDMRTIARLLAWVLDPKGEVNGRVKVRRDIPSRDQEDWSKAEVWAVLKQATSGKFNDAESFARALEEEEAKPSRHFIEQIPSPPPPPGWPRWLIPVLAGVLLMAIVGGLAYFLRPGPPNGEEIIPICLDCPKSSKLRPLLKEYMKAASDPLLEAPILEQMFEPSVLSDRKEYQKLERECIDPLVESTLGRLGDFADRRRQQAYDSGFTNPVFKQEAQRLMDLFVSLYAKKYGHTPEDKDYPKWYRQLSLVSKRLR